MFTSAEADYTAKGMIQQVQESIVSTREAQIQRENVQETTVINRQDVRVERTSETVAPPNRDPLAQSFFVDNKDGILLLV